MNSQNKNKKEFENVYHKNKGNVYRIAKSYSDSHKESWLITTTKNTAINYMKKRKREYLHEDIELYSNQYLEEHIESAEDSVFRNILLKEKQKHSWTILDALYVENERWYEAMTMVYCLGRKQKDVADAMGISLDVLTALLYRARKWVKKNYSSDNYT